MGDPRDDIEVFAAKVMGRPLWPHQAEAARAERFITSIAAARRTGKTTLVETLAAWTCFRERDVKAVILSAGLEAARRVTEELGADLARGALTRGAVTDDFATRIKLANGSEIVSLPASQRAVRGLGRGVKLVVVDEAGFVPEELWRAAHYTALDERRNGARIVLCGTPWGGPELFFRRAYSAGRDGDPDHAAFHWSFQVNPLLDQAYLERQRDRVAPAEYAAEVLGEWSDAIGSLFPRALLERQTADLEVPALGELAGPARPVAALDWGVSFDRSAAVLLYRVPVAALNPDREPEPCFVALPYVWPAGAPLHSVVAEVATCSAPFAYVVAETNGVGAMPSQELHRAARRPGRKFAFVATTSATKTSSYGAVLGLLERGRLVLPRHPDLLRQLAGLKFEQGERGFTRIGAEDPATHDDVADALALAMVPFRRRGSSRLRTLVPRLAALHPAEAPVPALEGPVVETGGGLRLPRRPVLQSVNGPEITLPPGARRVRQEDEASRAVRRAYEAARAANGSTT